MHDPLKGKNQHHKGPITAEIRTACRGFCDDTNLKTFSVSGRPSKLAVLKLMHQMQIELRETTISR